MSEKNQSAKDAEDILDKKPWYKNWWGIFLIILLFPVLVPYLVWTKTNWNKWIKITITVVCVFYFISIMDDSEPETTNNNQKEVALSEETEVRGIDKESNIPANKEEILDNPELSNVNLKENNKDQTETKLTEEQPNQNDIQNQEEIHKVVKVVDGDTVKLDNGETVRYIGIDTPETVHPSKPVECFGKEASDKNKELVEGKEVKLEKDVSETDKYGRLLRYIYIGDIFINDYLVRNGFANASSYPPDVKYQDQFKEAEEEARKNKRGLWADDACKKEPEPIRATSSSSSYTCDCSKTCSKMSSCAEAKYQLNVCGCSKRDGDDDGIPCESLCK